VFGGWEFEVHDDVSGIVGGLLDRVRGDAAADAVDGVAVEGVLLCLEVRDLVFDDEC